VVVVVVELLSSLNATAAPTPTATAAAPITGRKLVAPKIPPPVPVVVVVVVVVPTVAAFVTGEEGFVVVVVGVAADTVKGATAKESAVKAEINVEIFIVRPSKVTKMSGKILRSTIRNNG
jgi:hypothetical protein